MPGLGMIIAMRMASEVIKRIEYRISRFRSDISVPLLAAIVPTRLPPACHMRWRNRGEAVASLDCACIFFGHAQTAKPEADCAIG